MTLAAISPALAACGESATRAARPDPGRWLSAETTTRSATVTAVIAYDDAASGFNIDGANKGALLFTTPRGWRVSMRCVNNASGRRYACGLVRSPGATVLARPVVRATSELAPGAQATFSFLAGSPTRYRIVATTESHQPAGMWVTLEVTRSGTPSVRWVR